MIENGKESYIVGDIYNSSVLLRKKLLIQTCCHWEIRVWSGSTLWIFYSNRTRVIWKLMGHTKLLLSENVGTYWNFQISAVLWFTCILSFSNIIFTRFLSKFPEKIFWYSSEIDHNFSTFKIRVLISRITLSKEGISMYSKFTNSNKND